MITIYDYVIIGFYLVFMLAIGVVFRRMSKDTSDYFRAGGAMPWWLTGASAWIFSFSAWTFTGAAGKVYETGTLVLPVFYCTAVALCFVLAFTCLRFRRMRVITWMEGVRLRYGPFSEQFYTWIKLPLLLLFSGASLNAIGVFMSAVFNVPMNTMLIILGAVVTVVAFGGGSWAVLASDFVQAFLIVTITLCTAVMTLARPEIGGLGGLLHKVPSAHLHWTQLARPELIFVWIVATMWLKFSDENNMERATMYLMTRSDKDAKRMVLIPLIGTLIGPLIWFIPSMAASIMHPNLAAEFPGLKQPHEAAFLAVSMDVMPKGLLGLLLSAMLGATVTSMDAGLNKNVGIAIRSLYKPLIRPNASEKHLLIVGKMCTLLFGVIIILLAVFINSIRQTNLFDFLNQLAANLLMPLALPLIFGLFYKRTPGWSAWSTALVAGAASWLLSKYFSPEIFQHWIGWTKPLNADEATYLKLAVTTLGGTVLVGSAWYFFTTLFYRQAPEPERERIETFFANLHTPAHKEGVGGVQTAVYKLLGSLCLVYGAFILLLVFIPNRFTGRLAFLFCGGVMFSVGAILFTKSKRRAEPPAHVLSAAAEADTAQKK
ncbi:MAG TPA: transporter [Verrucomicrobiae bacterium]|nr:transporter [Verrucomicrobiae bacterium]